MALYPHQNSTFSFQVRVPIFCRGYAKRRNDYCLESEYANLSFTQMQTNRYVDGRPIDIDFPI